MLGSFSFDYEYKIEFEYDFSILNFILSQRIPITSHELLCLPKINMKTEGSGNVTGWIFESRTRTQSWTRSPI